MCVLGFYFLLCAPRSIHTHTAHTHTLIFHLAAKAVEAVALDELVVVKARRLLGGVVVLCAVCLDERDGKQQNRHRANNNTNLQAAQVHAGAERRAVEPRVDAELLFQAALSAGAVALS